MDENQCKPFKDGIKDIADGIMAYCERGRFLFEANLAIMKAKGQKVAEEINDWSKLTDTQKDFWVAMADHAERDLHRGKG